MEARGVDGRHLGDTDDRERCEGVARERERERERESSDRRPTNERPGRII